MLIWYSWLAALSDFILVWTQLVNTFLSDLRVDQNLLGHLGPDVGQKPLVNKLRSFIVTQVIECTWVLLRFDVIAIFIAIVMMLFLRIHLHFRYRTRTVIRLCLSCFVTLCTQVPGQTEASAPAINALHVPLHTQLMRDAAEFTVSFLIHHIRRSAGLHGTINRGGDTNRRQVSAYFN